MCMCVDIYIYISAKYKNNVNPCKKVQTNDVFLFSSSNFYFFKLIISVILKNP